MREVFWGVLRDEMARAHLGIAPHCEEIMHHKIEATVAVVRAHGWGASQTDVEAAFRAFVVTMVQSARAKGYAELHEDTLLDAERASAMLHPPAPWPVPGAGS